MDLSIQLVEGFKEAWAKPTVEKLWALLHPNCILHVPGSKASTGKEISSNEFKRLLYWLPGFNGTVTEFHCIGNIIFIEWVMHFPFKAKTLNVKALDKIIESDGLIKERFVFLDSAKVFRYILTHPSEWYSYYNYKWAIDLSLPRLNTKSKAEMPFAIHSIVQWTSN